MNCYVCSSDKFVDDHHYDCLEGKLSPETVPLCRRCHRTYHDFGVDWFDDEFLDKAIEIENKRREIWRAYPDVIKRDRFLVLQQPMRREDIQRSSYWNKTHGVKAFRQPKPVKAEKPEMAQPREDRLSYAARVGQGVFVEMLM